MHRIMIAFGVVTAPATVTAPELAAGRRLSDFIRRWKIICEAGRWGLKRAVSKIGFSVIL